ncbi:Non-catalytic module family DOC2 [Neocallimastix sp. 'constans']
MILKKKEWCGITPYNEILNKKLCWSEILGYLCYSECIKIIEIDSYSKWGVENYH